MKLTWVNLRWWFSTKWMKLTSTISYNVMTIHLKLLWLILKLSHFVFFMLFLNQHVTHFYGRWDFVSGTHTRDVNHFVVKIANKKIERKRIALVVLKVYTLLNSKRLNKLQVVGENKGIQSKCSQTVFVLFMYGVLSVKSFLNKYRYCFHS